MSNKNISRPATPPELEALLRYCIQQYHPHQKADQQTIRKMITDAYVAVFEDCLISDFRGNVMIVAKKEGHERCEFYTWNGEGDLIPVQIAAVRLTAPPLETQ